MKSEVKVMKGEVKVRYGAGRTLNLGNYESAKFEVSVEFTCPNTEDDLFETYHLAKNFVDDRIAENTKQVQL